MCHTIWEVNDDPITITISGIRLLAQLDISNQPVMRVRRRWSEFTTGETGNTRFQNQLMDAIQTTSTVRKTEKMGLMSGVFLQESKFNNHQISIEEYFASRPCPTRTGSSDIIGRHQAGTGRRL